MSVFLAPTFGVGYQAFNTNGSVLNGGQIFTYQAGSSTPEPTYTTSAGNVANGNPIILDGTGRPPSEIWLTAGQAYKFVLEDSLNNIIATYDNVSGINDIALPLAVSEWLPTNLTPTYVSTTSFTVSGTQIALFLPNLRLKSVNTGGTIYSTVQTATYNLGSGLTTVVVINDSGTFDSGLSSVSYGILNPANPSVPGEYLAFNPPVIAAVTATPVIGASASANITLTGSGVTITGFDSALSGVLRFVKFTGNNSLTNSSTLVLQQAPTMSVQSGDELVFRSLGSGLGWELIQFTPSLNNYAISGNHVLSNTDKGQRLTCTGSPTISGTASLLGAGWFCYVENDGVGTVTFSSAGSNIYQIGGSTTGQSSITIPDTGTGANPYNNSMVLITTDGTNFNVSPIVTPHGEALYSSNSTWICPKGIFSIVLSGITPGNGGFNGVPGGGAVGGAGGYAGILIPKQRISVVPGTSYAITIAGGASNGGVGVASFGVLFSLSTPSSSMASGIGGVGGSSSGGTGGNGTGVQFSGGTGGAGDGVGIGGGGGGGGGIYAKGGNGAAYGGSSNGSAGGGGGAGYLAGNNGISGGGGVGGAGGTGGAGLLIIEW